MVIGAVGPSRLQLSTTGLSFSPHTLNGLSTGVGLLDFLGKSVAQPVKITATNNSLLARSHIGTIPISRKVSGTHVSNTFDPFFIVVIHIAIKLACKFFT